MALKNYSVLKGRPIHNRAGTGKKPHYQVQISADGVMYRIAINVRSQDGSEVEYLLRAHFEHPVTDGLAKLEQGVHPLPPQPNGLALDFIRANLAQPWEFVPLAMSKDGPDNDLNDKIDALVQRAMADETAMVYAFGETWGPETKADQYFGFTPGRGIHDIHFNQGNPPGPFAGSNGPWQDGGLIFEFPEQRQWAAVFLKFQSQAWHSDDASGVPIIAPDPDHPGLPHTPVTRDGVPTTDVPDGLVRIMAAYVNDTKSPERETVTLLNTADVPVDLAGWALLDKQKNRMTLDGTMDPGATRLVVIAAPVQLSNKGGLITLLNASGVKVHGVSYTSEQARQPGRTIPF
jgi:hypothetical protein